DVVLALVAIERVVAVAAVDEVVAVVAGDVVVAVVPVQNVVAVAAVDQVVVVAARHAVVAVVGVHRVVAGLAYLGIVAVVGVAGRAKRVVAGAAEFEVVEVAAVHRIVAGVTEQGILPVIAVDGVGASTAEHQIVAAVAGKRVIGRRAVDRVVARTANGGEEERHFPSLSCYRRPRRAFGRTQRRLMMVCMLPSPEGLMMPQRGLRSNIKLIAIAPNFVPALGAPRRLTVARRRRPGRFQPRERPPRSCSRNPVPSRRASATADPAAPLPNGPCGAYVPPLWPPGGS